MRVGQNPAKFVSSIPEPARVTIAIITYFPFLEGYYAQGLEILKTCLGSLWSNTHSPYDLMVFDNASCPEVRAFLGEAQQDGKIQYLTLSDRNLGKTGGWNYLFGAAPGEIIAYADADIYFEPGWLENLTEVLDAYPEVGMITGIPMWSPAQYSTATAAWAEKTQGVRLLRGKLLPWEDYWQHARSLGQTEDEARVNFESQEDLLIEDHRPRSNHADAKPARFYAGAGHFQFIARKSILNSIIPIKADRPMGQVRRLDIAINDGGYLRLSTPDWWVRHLGNTLTGIPGSPPTRQKSKRPLRGSLRRVVQWIYHRSFEWLYRD